MYSTISNLDNVISVENEREAIRSEKGKTITAFLEKHGKDIRHRPIIPNLPMQGRKNSEVYFEDSAVQQEYRELLTSLTQ